MEGHVYQIIVERAYTGAAKPRKGHRLYWGQFQTSRRKGSERALTKFFEVCEHIQKQTETNYDYRYMYRVRLVHKDTKKEIGKESQHYRLICAEWVLQIR